MKYCGNENFVKDFAKSYYSWSSSKEAIEQRTTAIRQYMTKELQDLNVDTVRIDIPTSSMVKDVQIWSVTQSGSNEFNRSNNQRGRPDERCYCHLHGKSLCRQ